MSILPADEMELPNRRFSSSMIQIIPIDSRDHHLPRVDSIYAVAQTVTFGTNPVYKNTYNGAVQARILGLSLVLGGLQAPEETGPFGNDTSLGK
jgi:hypothetical protein